MLDLCSSIASTPSSHSISRSHQSRYQEGLATENAADENQYQRLSLGPVTEGHAKAAEVGQAD